MGRIEDDVSNLVLNTIITGGRIGTDVTDSERNMRGHVARRACVRCHRPSWAIRAPAQGDCPLPSEWFLGQTHRDRWLSASCGVTWRGHGTVSHSVGGSARVGTTWNVCMYAYSISGDFSAKLLYPQLPGWVAQSGYEACAKREVPLILFPNLKNKIAIGTISNVVHGTGICVLTKRDHSKGQKSKD